MLISFDCPKCLKTTREEDASQVVHCKTCGWTRQTTSNSAKDEPLSSCLVCGCSDLWRQKDFDQRLGVVIVGIGILLSTVAVAYMMPGIAMMILMVFGMADWVLYASLPDRLVCYRCHAQYRKVPNLEKTGVFDLEVNERYRQEAIRLKQKETSSPS